MIYTLTFIEGVITFISPCLLPMLPIYFTYIIGEDSNQKKLIRKSLLFCLGFSITFISLGVLAGSLGQFLIEYRQVVNIVSGLLIIMFGLSYLDLIQLKFINFNTEHQSTNAFILGIVFSVSWSPCVGAFLGSALLLAATSSSTLEGGVLLAIFSLGLAIPFILSAYLIDQLKGTFSFIKKNYQTIRLISGIFLIILGITVMLGYIEQLNKLLI